MDLLTKLLFSDLDFFFFKLYYGLNTESRFDFQSIQFRLYNEFDEALYLRSVHKVVSTLLGGVTVDRIWGVPLWKNSWWYNFAAWFSFIIIRLIFQFGDLILQCWKILVTELLKRLLWGVLGRVWHFALQLKLSSWLQAESWSHLACKLLLVLRCRNIIHNCIEFKLRYFGDLNLRGTFNIFFVLQALGHLGRAVCQLSERLKRLLLWDIVVFGSRANFDILKLLIFLLDLLAQLLNFFLHELELRAIFFSGYFLTISWAWLCLEWFIRRSLLLDSFLKLRDLFLLFESEFLSAHLHVVSLFDAKEKFAELHVLLEIWLIYIGLQCSTFVEFVVFASFLVRDLDLRRWVLSVFHPLDHFLDVFSVPLVQWSAQVDWLFTVRYLQLNVSGLVLHWFLFNWL